MKKFDQSSKAVPVTSADLSAHLARLGKVADLSSFPPNNWTPPAPPANVSSLFQLTVNIPKRAHRLLYRYQWALRHIACIVVDGENGNFARWNLYSENIELLTDSLMVVAIAKLGGSAFCIGQQNTVSIRLFITPRFAVRVIGISGQTILLCRRELQTMMFISGHEDDNGKALCIISKEKGLTSIRSAIKVVALAYNTVSETGPDPTPVVATLPTNEALVYRTLILSRVDQEAGSARSNPHQMATEQCNSMWPQNFPYNSACTETPYPEFPSYLPVAPIRAGDCFNVHADPNSKGHGLLPRQNKGEYKSTDEPKSPKQSQVEHYRLQSDSPDPPKVEDSSETINDNVAVHNYLHGSPMDKYSMDKFNMHGLPNHMQNPMPKYNMEQFHGRDSMHMENRFPMDNKFGMVMDNSMPWGWYPPMFPPHSGISQTTGHKFNVHTPFPTPMRSHVRSNSITLSMISRLRYDYMNHMG